MTTRYPKTRRENLAWRLEMLKRAKEDLKYRAQLKELFFRDALFAFNGFFYTYDVRKRPHQHLPFITWDYQDDAISEIKWCIEGGVDFIIEKSRDMGASWMVILCYLHEWLNPKGGRDFLLGSRIEDYVDKRGDMRTLMEKARYGLRYLPNWLKPRGWYPKRDDNFMRLLNPETGAVISGESNNPNFSTGGRYVSVLFDEFAKWESTDESAWTAAGDATPCRAAISTPFGAGGQFYNLVTDGKTKRIRLYWSLHPEKALGLSCVWPPLNEKDKAKLGEHWRPEEKLTSPWHESECRRRSPKEIAQEIEINYLGAGNTVFDGPAGQALVYYHSRQERVKQWAALETEDLKLFFVKEPFDPLNHLRIYREPEVTQRYTLGVDVVEGVEDGDFAVVCVLNRMTKDVDAIYHGSVDEVELARVVKTISSFYTVEEPRQKEGRWVTETIEPWTGIETNGPGLSTFDFCVALGMAELFMAPRYDVSKGSVSYKKGWRTDQYSRNELISGIRSYLRDRAGELNSQLLVGELLTFVRGKTGKPQAREGCHDDCVIAFGIAIQVDELAPLEFEEIKRGKREYGVGQHVVFDREDFKLDEDTSMEARCLRTLTEKKRFERLDPDEMLGELFEFGLSRGYRR